MGVNQLKFLVERMRRPFCGLGYSRWRRRTTGEEIKRLDAMRRK
jgi:hypothetical protein